MKIVPEQVARFVPDRPFVPLGTDGFGRSDTREALRRFFEVDAAHVVVAVLARPGRAGRGQAGGRRRRHHPLRHRPRGRQPGGLLNDRHMSGTLYITGDAEADGLLNTDGTALLIGMLLDQQVPMEWAFSGPAVLRQRLGHLDARKIAAMSEDDFVAVCLERPAIHRFPAAMGRRVHELCAVLAAEYDGDGANLWAGVDDGDELFRRLRALPGYGEEKSRIFVAILAKRQGVRPTAGRRPPASSPTTSRARSPTSPTPASLAQVREWKRAQKAAKLDKQDRPL